MRSIFFFITVLSFSSHAQSLFRLGIDANWNTGEATLHDGSRFKGVIKYNQHVGSITLTTDTLSKESKTFSEKDVFSMTLFDQERDYVRKFYSFPVSEKDQEIYLFEVIREFNNWAVLSRSSDVRALRAKGDLKYIPVPGFVPYTAATSKISQSDYYFVIDDKGVITLFFVIEEVENDGALGYKRSHNNIHQEILTDKMKPFDKEVERYAKKNKLKFHREEDLLEILDYYKDLAEN